MIRARHNFAPGRGRNAFTLMELILVLVIMAMVMALAAPSLRAWGRGSKLRDSGDDFLAAAKWSRVQSASNGAIYRLSLEGGNSFRVSVQNGQEFTYVESEFGRGISVPEGARIEAVGTANQSIDAIYFYPTGRVDPATVRITAADGESIQIACVTPADDFVVIGQGYGQ